MNLLHLNILLASVSCVLLLGGYAFNRRSAGVAAMCAGIVGLLLLIAMNIYAALQG